jgi:HD-GYP domain-containing protein (c-di-GMP phosphodiesterase class II)
VATADGLHSEIESKSPCFCLHWKAVSRWADVIAREMDLPEMDIRAIRKSAEIMDIGMLDLLDEIGTGPADERMKKRIEEHPVMSESILRRINPGWDILPLVRHHHECFDGTGYPDGLRGEEIPLGSRILTVADSLVAMASERPYRERRIPEEIIAELRRNSGSQFDPLCIEALIREKGGILGAFEDPRKIL